MVRVRKWESKKHLIPFKRAPHNGETINFHLSQKFSRLLFMKFETFSFSLSHFTLYKRLPRTSSSSRVTRRVRIKNIISKSRNKRENEKRRKRKRKFGRKSCIIQVSRFIPLLHFMKNSYVSLLPNSKVSPPSESPEFWSQFVSCRVMDCSKK